MHVELSTTQLWSLQNTYYAKRTYCLSRRCYHRAYNNYLHFLMPNHHIHTHVCKYLQCSHTYVYWKLTTQLHKRSNTFMVCIHTVTQHNTNTKTAFFQRKMSCTKVPIHVHVYFLFSSVITLFLYGHTLFTVSLPYFYCYIACYTHIHVLADMKACVYVNVKLHLHDTFNPDSSGLQ